MCKLATSRCFIIGGRTWGSIHCWFNVLSWHTNLGICHCLLFHEYGKQNFAQPFSLRSRKLLYATHMLGLNFTMKSWAESLPLMSVIMHGSYLKQTEALCVIWRYIPWAACPRLSLSAVAFSRWARWGPLACSSTCVNFVSVRSI